MYKIIRASEDWYCVIVMVEIEQESSQDKKYLLYNRRTGNYFRMNIGELEKLTDEGNLEAVFEEISEETARGYFSHIADGLGFGILPTEGFKSLGEVWEHIRENQREQMAEFMIRFGAATKNGIELLDALMRVRPLTAVEFRKKLEEHGLTNRWPEFKTRYHGKFRPEPEQTA